MLLDVSDLLKGKTSVMPFDVELNTGDIKRENFKIALKSSIKVKGTAEYDGEVVNLVGSLTATINAQCSRCLEYFDYVLNADFNEIFSKNSSDEEIYHFTDDDIELTEMIIDNIILNMPFKLLCSVGCKGLCPVCGDNLNRHQCNCNVDDIDSRFAVLKDLFKGD